MGSLAVQIDAGRLEPPRLEQHRRSGVRSGSRKQARHRNRSTTGVPRASSKAGRPDLQFVYTSHPGKPTDATLSLIRSHVARQDRQRKQKPAPVETDEGEDKALDGRRLQKRIDAVPLAPRPKQQCAQILLTEPYYCPSPLQLIGNSNSDARQGFARALTGQEEHLLNFYFTYVISYGYEACHHKEETGIYQQQMRQIWLPYALATPSLMAAIFHVACRNYIATTKRGDANHFLVKKLEYRIQCLQFAEAAISSECVASDTTIALALLMASESFFDGDLESFRAHGLAIVRMVQVRGGLDNLGISGFLRKIVGWSIFNPIHNFITGPIELGQSSLTYSYK